jgi:hypothetical protein
MAIPLHQPFNENEIRTQVVIVTPHMASEWLKNALRNRTPSSRRIDMYAESMRNGLWKLNGEPLLFDAKGRLMDGRHRLTACVQSGSPFETLCVFGVSHDVMETINTGVVRSPGDALQVIFDTQNSRHLAASLTWLWVYESNHLRVATKQTIPRAILMEYHIRNPHMKDSLSWGWKVKKLLPPGPASGLHYVMAQKDPNLADRFFETLAHGEGLSQKEGMYLLRTRLQEDWKAKIKMSVLYKTVLVIKIWNDWRQGKFTRSNLRWRIDENNYQESIPRIL